MNRRLKLHQILREVLGSDNVYFQPPTSVKMVYPAIVYKRQSIDAKFANNNLYGSVMGYMVSVIDPNPDSEIPRKILQLPMSSFSRHYTANNLNHDVFNVFF